MNTIKRYMIVDDDKANNMLCRMIFKKVFGDVESVTYDNPREALEKISSDYSDSSKKLPTVLFLDINMPDISGWEFMEHYKNFDESIHKQFTIYILSSSVDSKDKDLANKNPLITGYIQKPLTREKLKALFPGNVI